MLPQMPKNKFAFLPYTLKFTFSVFYFVLGRRYKNATYLPLRYQIHLTPDRLPAQVHETAEFLLFYLIVPK
jgi:hypothetical protein